MKTRNNVLVGAAVAAIVAAVSVSTAQAADESGARNWTGFYIGVTGGYGFGKSDIDAKLLSDSANPMSQRVSEDGKGDLDGGMVGGLVGYDQDLGNGLVIGVLGDLSWSGIGGNVDVDPGFTGVTGSNYDMNSDVSWLGTVRGRIGYAFGDALIYATGGLAFGGVETSLHDADYGHIASDNNVQLGWTVGGGLNYMATDNVMLGIEYLYVDLGKASYDFGSYGNADNDVSMSIIRGSLSYKF